MQRNRCDIHHYSFLLLVLKEYSLFKAVHTLSKLVDKRTSHTRSFAGRSFNCGSKVLQHANFNGVLFPSSLFFLLPLKNSLKDNPGAYVVLCLLLSILLSLNCILFSHTVLYFHYLYFIFPNCCKTSDYHVCIHPV